RGELPRGPARANRPVDLPPPGPLRAARGPRAEPRLRDRARLRLPRAPDQPDPPGPLGLPRARARGALDAELPRPELLSASPCDARAGRADHPGSGPTRGRAPARDLGQRRARRARAARERPCPPRATPRGRRLGPRPV